jgi:uncharacterized protein YggE
MKNLSINPIYIVVGILALLAFKSNNNYQYNNNSERVITVTGSADMLVPPDEILVDISYKEYWYSHHLKTKKSIQKIESGIIEAINEVGISKDKIMVHTAQSWRHGWNYWHYWYDYSHYLVEKKMTVRLKSSDQLNKVIEKLKSKSIKKEGIVNILLNGSSNKKIQEYRKMVKERAMQAAREKADYLLESLGEECGVVLTVQELSDSKNRRTTTTHGGYPYYHPIWGWGGGYGGSTTVNNGGMNAVSNSTVNMPSAHVSSSANGKNDLSMKPIKLRYEIQAQFQIVPQKRY